MKGFTLVDTLISAGLMVILALAILALVVTAWSLETSGRTYTTLIENARRALDRIEEDVRTVRPNKFQDTFPGGTNYANGGDDMSMVSCRDQNGRVVTDANGRLSPQEWIVYYCNSGRLLRATTREGSPAVDTWMSPGLQRSLINSGQGQVLADSVTLFSYSIGNGMLLEVTLYVEYKKASGTVWDSVLLTRKIRTNVGWDSANF